MSNSMTQALAYSAVQNTKELVISRVKHCPAPYQSMYIYSCTMAEEYFIYGVASVAAKDIKDYLLVNRNSYFISAAISYKEAEKLAEEYVMAASEVKMKVEVTTPSMSQEELQQLGDLLNKAKQVLNLSDSYTDIEVKFDKELNELVLRGDNLWVQNAYGKSRTISSKGVNDTEIMIC